MKGLPPATRHRVCFVGTHAPRRCGIATFTADLAHSVAPHEQVADVIAINESGARHIYPPEVVYQIAEKRQCAYRAAADYLNLNEYSVVCLQHEYGIFGGPAGSYVLQLLRNLRMPLVTTLHTLLEEPTPEQKDVLDEIVQLSQRVVVMSAKAKSILQSVHKVDPRRIDLIPHGAPNVSYVDPNQMKPSIDAEGRKVILTFGLLSPDKGVEHVIRALPELVKRHPDLLYIVLGATHPVVRAQTNDAYRKHLKSLARELGVAEHVRFEDRFVEMNVLTQYLQSADIYVTPYLKPQQITSGTLSYAFACGKPIVSTPYWHAAELLTDGRGVLVPFRDSASIEAAFDELLGNPEKLKGMAARAYAEGRSTTWKAVGTKYARKFDQAIQESRSQLPLIMAERPPSVVAEPMSVDIRHLVAMTDDTGLFQHAIGPIPNRHEGYCVDDNARALLVCSRLGKLGMASSQIDHLARIYLSFVHHAWNHGNGRFRNFLTFGRAWAEEFGSEDSHGRSIWGLGEYVASSAHPDLRKVALTVLDKALPAIGDFTSPRAWAYSIIGITQEASPLSGETLAWELVRDLAHRLGDLYRRNATGSWRWFEVYASYDNARLSQAMICAGKALEEPELVKIGLDSLDWICEHQVGAMGEFFPIGCEATWFRNDTKPRFDHQPLEAWGTVDACLEAASVDRRMVWSDRAKWAVDWFSGRNHLQQPVVDSRTGGCRDGIHADRMNENQGAESTLSYVAATARYLAFSNRANWTFVESER